MKKVIVLLLMLVTVTLGYSQRQQSTAIRHVSVSGFKEAIDSLTDEVVVDLRTPEEIKNGKIPGALEIDFFARDFEPSIRALNKNTTYLLYCASGGRSGETAEQMEKMGFKNLYNLKGGFREWQRHKMPVTR